MDRFSSHLWRIIFTEPVVEIEIPWDLQHLDACAGTVPSIEAPHAVQRRNKGEMFCCKTPDADEMGGHWPLAREEQCLSGAIESLLVPSGDNYQLQLVICTIELKTGKH